MDPIRPIFKSQSDFETETEYIFYIFACMMCALDKRVTEEMAMTCLEEACKGDDSIGPKEAWQAGAIACALANYNVSTEVH